MSKWKVRWTIEASDFDGETFDNFDSAKAKFYEKMEEGCEFLFGNFEDIVRYDLDEAGEDGEAIVQYIYDFFCGNLTQEDSLVVDYSGEDFNLCINKEGIDMEDAANAFDIFLTIQTDFLTVDDEDKDYSVYVAIYNPSEDVYCCEVRVVLEKI